MSKKRPPHHSEDSQVREGELGLLKYTEIRKRKLLRTQPNNYPRFIYKYISANISEEHLRDLLIDSDFYLSSPKDFNDPFDTTAQIVQQGTLKQQRRKFKQVVQDNLPNLKGEQLESKISELMARKSKNPSYVGDMFYANMHMAGIFCFTRNPRNILMWSHYASNHKGLVLQFNISKDIESLLNVLPMRYSKEYPKFGLLTEFENSFQEIMLSKSEDWRYEDELRMLKVGGAGTYQSFKPEALTGLIFGCKATDEFKANINEILAARKLTYAHKVNLYDAQMHESMYAINIYKNK